MRPTAILSTPGVPFLVALGILTGWSAPAPAQQTSRHGGIEIGAKGYVAKTGDPQDLVEAIREVGKGGVYLPPAIARSIAFAGPAFARSPLSKLTSREMEILRLLSVGKSLSEIAWLVHSSYKTVANTSSIMRQKLGVRTSAELVRLAIESGVA